MSGKRFVTFAGTAAPIRVVSLARTCDAYPAQWAGRTDDDREVYVRYRDGCGGVQVAGKGDRSEYAAVNGESVCLFERADDQGASDGCLTACELFTVTARFVTWPLFWTELSSSAPAQPAPVAGWEVCLQPPGGAKCVRLTNLREDVDWYRKHSATAVIRELIYQTINRENS